MVKIAKKLLLIFFTCTLLFASNEYFDELKAADKKIETASKDELLRLFHSLKNIYIQAIVSNDEKLKIEVLQRLVKTSNELGIDGAHYQKELATLNKKDIKIETKPLPKEVKKQEKVEPKVESTKKTITLDGTVLEEMIEKDEMLYLSFANNLTSKNIKYFQLKNDKIVKEVYDINGILTKSYDIKTPKGLIDIRIAQYDKDTIRVVLQRDDAQKSTYSFAENKLRIHYNQIKEKKQLIDTPRLHKSIAANKVIVIDAGHGGKDVGAVGYKRRFEKKAVLQIALEVGRELKKRGYQVYYTRSNDKFVNLRDRTKLANDKDADMFISIHANAASKESQHLTHKGLETYFLSPARSDRSKNIAALENQSDIEEMDFFSKQTFLNVFNREKIISANKLALDVQQGMLNNLRKNYKITDGGVREAPFWVLVGAQMPSILIEVGYITNPTESERMFNITYQKKLAYGVANGIDSYLMKNN